MELLHQRLLVRLDAFGDVSGRLDGLVLIEGAGEGNLIAHLGLALVNPRVRIIGQDLAGKIGVNVLVERHILCITHGSVRHRLAALHDLTAVFVQFWAFHHDFVVAEAYAVKHAALAGNGRLSVGGRNGIFLIRILAVGGHDKVSAKLCDVHTLVADGLAAAFIAFASINELDLADVLLRLVLDDNPDIGCNAGVKKYE